MGYLYHKPDSSVIKYAVYDIKREALAIQFQSNTVWVYLEVPIDVYDEMIAAKSTGNYFNKHIRNVYPSERFIAASDWNAIQENFFGEEKQKEERKTLSE